jgi:hypothetical protein
VIVLRKERFSPKLFHNSNEDCETVELVGGHNGILTEKTKNNQFPFEHALGPKIISGAIYHEINRGDRREDSLVDDVTGFRTDLAAREHKEHVEKAKSLMAKSWDELPNLRFEKFENSKQNTSVLSANVRSAPMKNKRRS